MAEKNKDKKPDAKAEEKKKPKTIYVAGKKMTESQYKKLLEKQKDADVALKERAEKKAVAIAAKPKKKAK